MAELKRLISSRRGYRAHLKKLLHTLTETLSEAHPPLSEDQIATRKDLHDQLERKQDMISNLDAKILEGITDDTEIETEILVTEDINSSISSARSKIVHRLNSATPPAVTELHRMSPSPSVPAREHFTRLPKLDPPQFTGNPLHWQSFWDCFEATVDSNSSLTGVQKLSYLRAQLSGDAARVIAGFQLNNDNYTQSVTSLENVLVRHTNKWMLICKP